MRPGWGILLGVFLAWRRLDPAGFCGRRDGLRAAALLTLPPEVARGISSGKPQVFKYGRQAEQVAELWLPSGKPKGVVVLIHGGFWLAQYGKDLMTDLALDVVQRDYAALNLEYRRVGSPTWKDANSTLSDVSAGLGLLESGRLPLDGGLPFAVVGHSAGGHLALWSQLQAANSSPAAAVVSTGGVLDLCYADSEELGGVESLTNAGALVNFCEKHGLEPVSISSAAEVKTIEKSLKELSQPLTQNRGVPLAWARNGGSDFYDLADPYQKVNDAIGQVTGQGPVLGLDSSGKLERWEANRSPSGVLCEERSLFTTTTTSTFTTTTSTTTTSTTTTVDCDPRRTWDSQSQGYMVLGGRVSSEYRSMLSASEMSVEIMFKLEKKASHDHALIFGTTDDMSFTQQGEFAVTVRGHWCELNFVVWGPGFYTHYNGPNPQADGVCDNKWHHLAAVIKRSESMGYLYLDGRSVIGTSTIRNLGSTAFSTDFVVGTGRKDCGRWCGSIPSYRAEMQFGHLVFWKRALAKEEVGSGSGQQCNKAGMVAYYGFHGSYSDSLGRNPSFANNKGSFVDEIYDVSTVCSVGGPCLKAQAASLHDDYVASSFVSGSLADYDSPGGLGRWTFKVSSTHSPGFGTEKTLQYATSKNEVRAANCFITPRSEGTAFDLPAIGTSTGVLISPASREGKADDNSLALHTGHNRNKEYLMVKFKATRAVNVAGYASELGAHCGGIDVWMYKGSTLVASKNGLNSDTPFTFPATTLAAGSTLTISVGPNGNFGCDHSSLSLTIN